MTKRYAYDIEVFPNLFSVIFVDLDSETSPIDISRGLSLHHPDVKTFVYAPEFGLNDLWQLEDFMNQDDMTIYGFNNIYYDEVVMDYVISQNPSTQDIFKFSSNVITRMNGIGSNFSYTRNYEGIWDSVDLMKMMAFDSLGVSLKQVSINLKWHRVQDLPYDFNHKLIDVDEVSKVLDYNLNDVLITVELYRATKAMSDLREDLSDSYGIDLRSASDSRMANLILEKIYSEESGLHAGEFSHLRTVRELVWLRNCIGKNISFKTKPLQKLLRKIMNTVVVQENDYAFKERIVLGNCTYDIGVGGLHSVDAPALFESTSEHIIRDADVASYYPNIILKNEIIPKHLDKQFVQILDKVTKERIEAKRKKDMVKANGLKITINSMFGKLNSSTYWLQDAKAMLSVTLSGQLYLLMLVEELMLAGIMTISANTDGIVCRIPVELEDAYYRICENWESVTGFELEYTDYKKYLRNDVNNYTTVKPDGKVKQKGRHVKEIGLNKGFRYPIVPIAMYNYWVNGIPVMETIRNHDDILDFCISQKAGSAFKMEYHQLEEYFSEEIFCETRQQKEDFLLNMGWYKAYGEKWFAAGTDADENGTHWWDGTIDDDFEDAFETAVEEYRIQNSRVSITTLQKNNRFYVCGGDSGGKLIKRNKETGKTIGIMASENVIILNDYMPEKPIHEYGIDYSFYEKEIYKYIEPIESSTFDLEFKSEELGDDIHATRGLVEISEDVKILPPKFRKSSGTYIYDEVEGVIYRGIAQINFLTVDTGELLYSIRDIPFDSFFDFLVYNKTTLGLNTRQMITLIKINFFSEFGKNAKLLTFYERFAKIYKPEQTEKTIARKTDELLTLWNETPNKSLSIKKQLECELELLGFIQSTFDKPKVLYVMNIDTRFSPKLSVYSLKSGKSAIVKIQKRIFNMTSRNDGNGNSRPLEAGDFILYREIEKKPAVRKGRDGESDWVEIPDTFDFWVMDYEIL